MLEGDDEHPSHQPLHIVEVPQLSSRLAPVVSNPSPSLSSVSSVPSQSSPAAPATTNWSGSSYHAPYPHSVAVRGTSVGNPYHWGGRRVRSPTSPLEGAVAFLQRRIHHGHPGFQSSSPSPVSVPPPPIDHPPHFSKSYGLQYAAPSDNIPRDGGGESSCEVQKRHSSRHMPHSQRNDHFRYSGGDSSERSRTLESEDGFPRRPDVRSVVIPPSIANQNVGPFSSVSVVSRPNNTSLQRQQSAPVNYYQYQRPLLPSDVSAGAASQPGFRPRIARSLSRTQTFKNYVKRNTASFFGVNEEKETDLQQRWRERRIRLASKQYGKLREDVTDERTLSQRGSVVRPPSLVTDTIDGGGHMPWHRQISRATDATENSSISIDPTLLRRKESVARLTWDGLSFLAATVSRSRSSVRCRRSKGLDRRGQSFRLPSTCDDSVFVSEGGGSSSIAGPPLHMPSTSERDASSDILQNEGDSLEDEVFFNRPVVFSQLIPPPSSSDLTRQCSEVSPDQVDAVVGLDSGVEISSEHWDGVPDYRNWNVPVSHIDPSVTSLVTKGPSLSEGGAPIVGMGRIWKRILNQMLDNSNRRQYGMGIVGRVFKRSFRKERITSDIREQLNDIDDHRPYFTYWVTTVQILITIMTLAVYGFGPIGFEQTERSDLVLVTSLSLQQVVYYEPDNFWIGPRAADLVHLGAKFAPCMRWDQNVMSTIETDRIREKDTACCIQNDNAGCIQATRDDCSTTISTWKKWTSDNTGPGGRISGSVCGQDPNYCSDPPSVPPYSWPDDITKWPICRKRVRSESIRSPQEHMACEVIGHPCCIGILGECQITTRDYCDFVKGYFHEEAALCSQVSCLNDICGMIPFYKPDVPDQFYRLWTSLFLHAGLFHLLITILVQYSLMRDLEKLVGPVRIGIIYIVSGIAGNLASAIFIPYRAEVGPAGSQFGLLACLIVEVIHCWPMLKCPRAALSKLLLVLMILFLIGLLPWVDNYAHMFGFVFGFLLSYALLPFVSFGAYDRQKKVALIWVCTLLVMGLFVVLLLLFYVHPIYECEICKYLTCIPFTDSFCATQDINITSRRHL